MDSLLGRIGYKQAYAIAESSAIALGVREKLKSSFSGDNLRELKSGQRSLSTARSDRFPIPIYSQLDKESLKDGFKIREEKRGFHS